MLLCSRGVLPKHALNGVYQLIQALRKTEGKSEIPGLLKRLASLRQQAATEEREQYRYKLVEGETELKLIDCQISFQWSQRIRHL